MNLRKKEPDYFIHSMKMWITVLVVTVLCLCLLLTNQNLINTFAAESNVQFIDNTSIEESSSKDDEVIATPENGEAVEENSENELIDTVETDDTDSLDQSSIVKVESI